MVSVSENSKCYVESNIFECMLVEGVPFWFNFISVPSFIKVPSQSSIGRASLSLTGKSPSSTKDVLFDRDEILGIVKLLLSAGTTNWLFFLFGFLGFKSCVLLAFFCLSYCLYQASRSQIG